MSPTASGGWDPRSNGCCSFFTNTNWEKSQEQGQAYDKQIAPTRSPFHQRPTLRFSEWQILSPGSLIFFFFFFFLFVGVWCKCHKRFLLHSLDTNWCSDEMVKGPIQEMVSEPGSWVRVVGASCCWGRRDCWG